MLSKDIMEGTRVSHPDYGDGIFKFWVVDEDNKILAVVFFPGKPINVTAPYNVVRQDTLTEIKMKIHHG